MRHKNGLYISLSVLRISKLFIANPGKQRCGYEVAKTLGMRPNTTYGILDRLEGAQWLTSRREADNRFNGRSPRKLYQITGHGHVSASAAFALLATSS